VVRPNADALGYGWASGVGVADRLRRLARGYWWCDQTLTRSATAGRSALEWPITCGDWRVGTGGATKR